MGKTERAITAVTSLLGPFGKAISKAPQIVAAVAPKVKPAVKAASISTAKAASLVSGTGNAWKDKVVLPSSPHTNKTDGHWFASMRVAVNEAKKSDTTKVYLNKGIQNEVKGNNRNRPDVMIVKSNGKVNQVEVPSKTDNPQKLMQRMMDNQKALGNRAGSIKIEYIRR